MNQLYQGQPGSGNSSEREDSGEDKKYMEIICLEETTLNTFMEAMNEY